MTPCKPARRPVRTWPAGRDLPHRPDLPDRPHRPAAGFTLIELLVVLAIIASLLTLAVPRYFRSLDRAAETVLIENLRLTREVIDQFYADTGQYPESLQQLVERQYLRTLPLDPLTESTQTWLLVAPGTASKGKVYNLRSAAPGTARSGQRFSEL